MPNILLNKSIQIQDFSLPSIYKNIVDQSNVTLKRRQIAFFSFALNWYIGKDNVSGYHLFNNFIHLLTAIFLYAVICQLLTIDRIKHIYHGNVQYIALLSATLWAVNPIQTQAVTYIVQRMTSMSALFSIIAMYVYLLLRKNSQHKTLSGGYIFCAFLYCLAYFTKESGILLPGSIVLIELVFFQSLFPIYFKTATPSKKINLLVGFFLLLIVFTIILCNFDPSTILDSYKVRNFTLVERLLTQPRVLFFYLSQIFYPLAERLSTEHDFQISTTFFTPWTTTPSILLLISLVIFALLRFRKYPLLSFSILFYFYNHILESSFLSLEMVFEHRNYLPSFFLFCPIICWIAHIQNRLKNSLVLIINSAIICFIIFSSMGTYSRNFIWSTAISLNSDSILKGSSKARPYNNLAINKYVIENSPAEAIALLNLAKEKQEEQTDLVSYYVYDNLRYIYQHTSHDEQAIIDNINGKISVKPGDSLAHEELFFAYLRTGEINKSLDESQILINISTREGASNFIKEKILYYLNLRILALYKLGQINETKDLIYQALDKNPNDSLTLINLGYFFMLSKNYYNAEKYFSKALALNPELISLIFLLIENSIKSDNKIDIDKYISKLFATAPISEIFRQLDLAQGNNEHHPIDVLLIKPVIFEQLTHFQKKLAIQ